MARGAEAFGGVGGASQSSEASARGRGKDLGGVRALPVLRGGAGQTRRRGSVEWHSGERVGTGSGRYRIPTGLEGGEGE